MNDLLPFAAALAIGLLIGAERERRKGTTRERGAAGIRTFALTAMLGTVTMSAGGVWFVVAMAVGLSTLLAVAYLRPHDDPGLTTEVALLLTLTLGALAQRAPGLSVALGVAVAYVLQVRFRLHRFVTGAITERELQDALLLAVAALIILPVLPDRPIDGFHALNPYTIWRFTVVMLLVALIGHIAQRVLGPRAGLPVTGFVSGFASSIATISAMGALAKRNPERLPTAAAGAVLSTIATMIQLGIVIGTIHPGVLIQLAFPLGAGALSALAYALWALWRASRQNGADMPVIDTGIDLKSALILTLSVSLVMLASGALSQWYGRAGLLVVAMTGGLADAHSVAASVTSLVEQGQLSMPSAALPILAGVSTNALAKSVVAAISGGPRFAKTVVPGLVFVVAAIWLADLLSSTGGAPPTERDAASAACSVAGRISNQSPRSDSPG